MNKIQRFEKNFKELLNEKADEISFTTQFIKRKRKIKGSSFAKAMVMGNLAQECSLEGICSLFSQEEISITKQGINLRFTKESATFMESLHKEALSMIALISIYPKVCVIFIGGMVAIMKIALVRHKQA